MRDNKGGRRAERKKRGLRGKLASTWGGKEEERDWRLSKKDSVDVTREGKKECRFARHNWVGTRYCRTKKGGGVPDSF